MAELATKRKRRGNDASEETGEDRSQHEDVASEEEQEPAGSADEESRDDQETLTGELKSAAREAAIEVLKPVVRKATTSAAKYAVTKGPGLVKDRVAPKLEDAGGAGALVKGVASKGGGIAETVREAGLLTRRAQTGLVRTYALAIAASLAVLTIVFVAVR